MKLNNNLTNVREKNDLKQWFKFFLVGIIETATNEINTFDEIIKLSVQFQEKLQTLGSKARKANVLLTKLYQNPITDAKEVMAFTGWSHPTVYRLFNDLIKLDILAPLSEHAKYKRQYSLHQYLALFET